jgi:hypothetical protein
MKQDHSGSQRSLLDVVIKMERDQCKYLKEIKEQSGPCRSILGGVCSYTVLQEVRIYETGSEWVSEVLVGCGY